MEDVKQEGVEEFKGKDILIVGRSYSAEDIGSQCWKYGAKSVTTTYRSKPMGFKWPKNFEERPLLQKVEGNITTMTPEQREARILELQKQIFVQPED